MRGKKGIFSGEKGGLRVSCASQSARSAPLPPKVSVKKVG